MKINLYFTMLATVLFKTSTALEIIESSLAVEVGTDVTIQCVDVTPPISWTFNDNNLEAGERHNITLVNGNSNLTISDVTMADSGKYTCADSSGNFDAILTVYIIPVVDVTSDPPSQSITTGENRTLTCDSNAYAEKVEWRKNGKELDESLNIVIEDNSLIIINSALTDAGDYKCIINITDIAKKPIVGEDTFSLIAHVSVVLGKNVKLEEGETARIDCNASGYPVPIIAWYRGNEKLENGSADGRLFYTIAADVDNELVVVSKMNIRRITSDDAGMYSCNATNNHTSDGGAYNVDVRDPLAALWPFLGIMAEVIILIILILSVEFYQKKRQSGQ